MTAPSFSILSAALSCHALHDPPNHLHLGKEPKLKTSLQIESYGPVSFTDIVKFLFSQGGQVWHLRNRATYASWSTVNEMAKHAYLVSRTKTCSVSVGTYSTTCYHTTQPNPPFPGRRFLPFFSPPCWPFFAYPSIIGLLYGAVCFCSLDCEIVSPASTSSVPMNSGIS